MKPDTERPEACAIRNKVHVFVGGAWQAMTVAAAEKFNSQISEAIALAKASEEPKS